ncbi:hypothetical protein PILCRDRAFT_607054 [Piloderma croceum F 1598]|uniref:Fungal N-terminal domain-containing protein n=1 Tax=Piloderma croceum (strain F 1598) TaxID=765440 RepID=A0A0C3EZI4_PILCF|nr:hypothetical protein PILCRDRAFT_607054 [Piloderma croceum F 1598]
MSFNRASHVDVRGSNFSNVSRDHNVVHVYNTINNITFAGSDQTHTPARYVGKKRLHNDDGDPPMSMDNSGVEDRTTAVPHKRRKLSSNFLRNSTKLSLRPISGTEDLAEVNSAVLLHHPSTCTAVSVAITLVVKIIQLLVDRGETRDDYRILELELESLRQTLDLISLAINTPLGSSLTNSIIPEVEQICVLVQKLFDKIEDCRQGLSLTSLPAMWRRVWSQWRVLDGIEFYSMDGIWKRVVGRSYLSQRFPCTSKTRAALPASNPSRHCSGCGSFRSKYPGADHVLFHLAGF